MWTAPITDRAQKDIEQRTSKAYCNALDLQRLEDNCAYLAGLLGISIPTRTWVMSDFPTVSELARIRDNLQALRDAYYTLSSTPSTPENPLNHWQKWNDIEQILLDLYTLYNANLEAKMYTGEVYTGQTIGVI